MYSCPRLVEVPRGVQLPTVMYKMPLFNVISDIIHGDPSLPSTTTTTKSCPEACVLEARQEAVLRRLQTLKDQLDRLQCTRTTTAAAAGSVVATLGAAAVASPARLTAERNDNMEAAGEHPLTLPERHQGVLEVISALRGEMRFLADLQKWMDEREEVDFMWIAWILCLRLN
ncbi:hypothetical protein GWK47_046583 [Chionoecetes opilio]|uniref:Uncharacterized protein n=1 Tax=Chionoecetes opilio TaxID=41210 RepID=A0A8J5CGX3_CHIOP|nr:hypothetical protein GWK47_046583 [Chionoecetes opilio]